MSEASNSGTDDKLLLLQLREGNHAAFTLLYRAHSPAIYRKIRRMVADEDLTKELVQEVFLKVWDKRESIDPAKSFRSFLFTIAVNRVYDHFRQVARDKKLEDRLVWLATEYVTIEQENPLSEQQLQAIDTVIGRLSPQRKQIYQLCKMEGLSYEEVSQALNISTATVRDHMVKANKTIRNYLKPIPMWQ